MTSVSILVAMAAPSSSAASRWTSNGSDSSRESVRKNCAPRSAGVSVEITLGLKAWLVRSSDSPIVLMVACDHSDALRLASPVRSEYVVTRPAMMFCSRATNIASS